MQKHTKTIAEFLGSTIFLSIILGLFSAGALWIAITSLYPMAFDEEFHYGLLQIYATSWLPYGIEHTKDMAEFGAATGDPSYLFHYLMSFPYRLMDWIGINDTAIIIVLRIMNLGFVVTALALFRKVMLEGGLRSIVVNVSVAFLCLIPVFSMLAGQINYDNLLLLVVALSLLYTVRVTNALLEHKSLPARESSLLVIALLFGMSIKYAFLPIAAATILWIIGLSIFNWHKNRQTPILQLKQFGISIASLKHRTKLSIVAFGGLGVFFAAHYVTNTVQYGSPLPDCAVVFDEEACTAYGPWNRNRNYVNNLSANFQPLSFPTYMAVEWLPGMTERLTFALAGKTNDFQTKSPLPLVLYGFIALTILGMLSLLLPVLTSPRQVRPFTWLILFVFGSYIAVLSYQLYNEYVRTGQPVAINGRYLLLLLPVFGAVLVDAVSSVFRRVPAHIKTALLIAILALMLIGGSGVGTYILQSEAHWSWPWARDAQAIVQHFIGLFTLKWRINLF